jgi:Mor family transcriptional regulator
MAKVSHLKLAEQPEASKQVWHCVRSVTSDCRERLSNVVDHLSELMGCISTVDKGSDDRNGEGWPEELDAHQQIMLKESADALFIINQVRSLLKQLEHDAYFLGGK